MNQAKNLILRLSITMLVCINFIALSVSAQDVTQKLEYTRTVCVEGVGCMYTHLRDEALDELFLDKERITGIDQTIDGYWTLNFEVTRECSDSDKPEVSAGTEKLQIWAYSEDETGQTIQVDAIYGVITFYKIGAGMYVSELEIRDATTTGGKHISSCKLKMICFAGCLSSRHIIRKETAIQALSSPVYHTNHHDVR